jgi:hypothetical protein
MPTPPAPSVVTLSFRPIRIKFFRSKKGGESLLVVHATCVRGSVNIIRHDDGAHVHLRPSLRMSTAPPLPNAAVEMAGEIIDDIERVAISLLSNCHSLELDGKDGLSRSLALLKRRCWVNADDTKRLVINAHANVGRNRKGDRLVECIELLALHDGMSEVDEDVERRNADHPGNVVLGCDIRRIRDGIDDDDDDDNDDCGAVLYDIVIDCKSERHAIFARWLVDTYGRETLSRGSGVLDVAGGMGIICRTLLDMGVPSTLLDPNPRHVRRREEDVDHHTPSTTTNSSSSTIDADTTATVMTPPFEVIPLPLYGDGSDLTSRDDHVGRIVNDCSVVCGLHPDQATEAIVSLALRLDVPFAIVYVVYLLSIYLVVANIPKHYINDHVSAPPSFISHECASRTNASFFSHL